MVGIALRIDQMQALLARFELVVRGIIHLDAAGDARVLGMCLQKSDRGIQKARFQLHIAIQQQQIIAFTIQPAQLVADTAAAVGGVIQAYHHRAFRDSQFAGVIR